MDATSISGIRSIQAALNVISVLQMTAYRFPRQATVNDGDRFDYIIAGGGTAGCVLANRLTEDPHARVLLVEAGGDPPLESVMPGLLYYVPQSYADWNTTGTIGGFGARCTWNNSFKFTRGRMLGGTSGLSVMIYARGDPITYNNWAAITKDDTWSYHNMLPYFLKNERYEDQDKITETKYLHGPRGYLGLTRPKREENIPILNAFREVGHTIVNDANGPERLYFSEVTNMAVNGVRQSTAEAFLSPIAHRPNLFVLKNTVVEKILFDKRKNAIGLRLNTQNKKSFEVKADKEVILSAGALGSPKILMLSGIGPRKDLQKLSIPVISDLPVGEDMKDNIHVLLFHILDQEDTTASDPVNYQDVPRVFINGFASADNTSYPTYQTYHAFITAGVSTYFCSVYLGLDQNMCQEVYEQSIGKRLLMTFVVDVDSPTRGWVRLRDLDPQQNPVVRLNLFPGNEELDKKVRYVRDFLRVEKSSYFKKNVLRKFEPSHLKSFGSDTDEYWRNYVRCLSYTAYQFSGTAAMGTVVDSRLRVLGVNRLRVVDASIYPSAIRANAGAGVIAVAEKAADMIKNDNRPT